MNKVFLTPKQRQALQSAFVDLAPLTPYADSDTVLLQGEGGTVFMEGPDYRGGRSTVTIESDGHRKLWLGMRAVRQESIEVRE